MGLFSIKSQVSELKIKKDETTKKGNIVFYKGKPFTGKLLDFYDSGNKKFEVDYRKGVENGNMYLFHENGQIQLQAVWSKGKRLDMEIGYDEDGNKIYEGIYRKGHLLERMDYYSSGKKRRNRKYIYSREYQENVPHGEEFVWDEDGNIEQIFHWKNGLPDN